MYSFKFDINKACEKKCQPLYTKTVTGVNDPTITKAMRYAIYVRTAKPQTVNSGTWLANHK